MDGQLLVHAKGGKFRTCSTRSRWRITTFPLSERWPKYPYLSAGAFPRLSCGRFGTNSMAE